MRDIKFRAWEIEKEEMISVDDINFNGDGLINTRGAWRAFSEVELMQYTGLKDKNGVEIYEGDILDFTLEQHYDGIYQEMNYKQPIVFSKGSFWAGNNLLHAVICADEELRVIGSIYENPELLEEVTK